jgi:3',5'-cyclic AMP phosphodiesterase CpdA
MLRKLFSSETQPQPPKFYLTSFDSKSFSGPRLCTVIKALVGDERNDYLLVSIHPNVISPKDGVSHDRLVVAGKYESIDLKNPNQDVYICVITDSQEIDKGTCSASSIKMVATGELFPVDQPLS